MRQIAGKMPHCTREAFRLSRKPERLGSQKLSLGAKTSELKKVKKNSADNEIV
jgi:hypothetical protein